MGMTREEFGILCKAMKAVYTDPKFIPDKDAFNVWYEILKDIDYKIASLAIQKYMSTEKFPPTIADIRGKAKEVTTPPTDELTGEEAWTLARKAVGMVSYYDYETNERVFKELPRLVQKTLVSADKLVEIGMMDSESVGSVEKSHFLRNYRTVCEREKEDAQLPEGLRKMIGFSKHGDFGKIEIMQNIGGEIDG